MADRGGELMAGDCGLEMGTRERVFGIVKWSLSFGHRKPGKVFGNCKMGTGNWS